MIAAIRFDYAHAMIEAAQAYHANLIESDSASSARLVFQREDILNTTFEDNTFDVVYAHGVLQYTADAKKMIEEAFRVLKPGGIFIGMVYNRKGWLNFMARVFKVSLEHQDAPVLDKYTIEEFRELLSPFKNVKIVPERFPVKSRLHHGLKGILFNTFFVGIFKLIPRPLVKKWGWHLMGFGEK